MLKFNGPLTPSYFQERLLLKHELAGARQDAKLRQVLEIVGGVSDGESSQSSDKSDSSPSSRNTSV